MKLTENEKSVVRGMIHSPQWQVVQRVAELLIQELRSESVMSDTEWATLSSTLLKEGRTQGIERFFQELNEQAAKEKEF